MRRIEKLLSYTASILGVFSALSFIVSYFIFETLRPKMVQFEALTRAEENLINFVGIGLLFFLAFSLLSFYKIAEYLKNAKKISLFPLFLLAPNVLSLLFIFGDIALLSDIGKQYKLGLSQPEWTVLYILVAFQLVSTLVLTYANLFKLGKGSQVKYIAKDSNIFIIAQYIGAICGLMGLLFAGLSFLFPTPLWMMKIHVLTTAFFLCIPYVLIVFFWLFIKIKEREKSWYDEKQIQDIGRSSFLTLVLSIFIMAFLFFLNFGNPDGALCVLWLPFYLFLVLFLFSLLNLFYSQKN